MILKFINFLERQNIDYLILNGYEDLFKEPGEGDIDIIFKQRDFKIIEDIIKNVCQENNWSLVQIYHQGIWAKNIFLFDLNTHELLNLDAYGILSRMNVRLFTEKELFKKARIFKNIKVLNPCHELIYYLSKKLDKNDLTDHKFISLRKLFLSNIEDCKVALKIYFPTTHNLIEKSFINDEIQILKREILIEDFRKRRTYNFSAYLKNMARFSKRVLYPTGFTLAFLGPDGSGKSTIINLLKESNLPFRQKKYFHLRPIKVNTTDIQVINPHEKPKYNHLKSYIKLVYLMLQYNLGWLKNIVPLKIKSTLVIFDRYYDDLLVDTKRYRYGGNLFIAALTKKCIPKPDIYFVLTASPQIIYNRKKEVSFQELERQIRIYNFLAKNQKYYFLEASKSPEEILNEVMLIIMENMSKKFS